MLKAAKGRTRIFAFRSGGFSLIELLVALALLIAVLAIAPAYFSRGVSSAEFRDSARQIASGLRSAQARAISSFQEQVFLLDLDKLYFSIDEDETKVPLPENINLKLKTAESERVDESRGGIRFFPDGSSTGGEIKLSKDGRSLKVAVNWATGMITIVGNE